MKQEDFTKFERRIGKTCTKLAKALGFLQRAWVSTDEVPPVNQPSNPAPSRREKRKANDRGAASPPPMPRPSKRSRKEQARKTRPGREVFDGVVIETPVRKYNPDLTHFMDKYEIERRKYHGTLLSLEAKLEKIGFRESAR